MNFGASAGVLREKSEACFRISPTRRTLDHEIPLDRVSAADRVHSVFSARPWTNRFASSTGRRNTRRTFPGPTLRSAYQARCLNVFTAERNSSRPNCSRISSVAFKTTSSTGIPQPLAIRSFLVKFAAMAEAAETDFVWLSHRRNAVFSPVVPDEFFARPLWPDGEPDWWTKAYGDIRRILDFDPEERGEFPILSDTSPGRILLVWDPEVLSAEEYTEIVTCIGDVVRADGGMGVQRLFRLFGLRVAGSRGGLAMSEFSPFESPQSDEQPTIHADSFLSPQPFATLSMASK